MSPELLSQENLDGLGPEENQAVQDTKDSKVSWVTVLVPEVVCLGLQALRDHLDPAGALGILEERESPEMEEHQDSTEFTDLLAQLDLGVDSDVKERRALRTIPRRVWG